MVNLHGMGEMMLHNCYLTIDHPVGTIRMAPLKDALIDLVGPWKDEPAVRTALYIQPGFLRSGISHWFTSIRLDPYRLDWAIRVGNRAVGVFSANRLDWEMHHGTLGILIGNHDDWGKGIGRAVTQAMVHHLQDQYHLRMLFALVNGDNPRAERLLTSLGFTTSKSYPIPTIPTTTPEGGEGRLFAYHAAL